MGDDPSSPFLSLPATAWLASNELAFAIPDGYPVSEGHTLIIPKRLVAGWWDATEAEQHALLALAEQVKQLLEGRYAPDGWNLGVNVGRAAGQTVDHLHLHLIPRYDGDVADPRGGVRHAIPARGNWETLGAEPSAGYDTWEPAREDRATTAWLMVPPTKSATSGRVDLGNELLAARPTVVALDVAADGSPRSREVLEDWAAAGGSRVSVDRRVRLTSDRRLRSSADACRLPA